MLILKIYHHTLKLKKKENEGGYLTLTLENVEMVLDEMRPYLMSDG